MSTLGDRLQPPYNDYEQEARRQLIAASNNGHPEHGIKQALVGIGYAVLHWASTQQQKGAQTNGDESLPGRS